MTSGGLEKANKVLAWIVGTCLYLLVLIAVIGLALFMNYLSFGSAFPTTLEELNNISNWRWWLNTISYLLFLFVLRYLLLKKR